MKNLIPIQIASIYKTSAGRDLPKRMALCTPDMHKAILGVQKDVKSQGGHLYLSDLFRSYEMQLQSHKDYVSRKKKAFSPAPGGSLHEAGRALDLDLEALGMPLAAFWPIAEAHGLRPIIDKPISGASESWHFDCRGSHDLVYQYYKTGKGKNMKPYAAMAASAILAIGVRVDAFLNELGAYLQSCLIRLGQDIGNIDGVVGPKTLKAATAVGLTGPSVAELITQVEAKLWQLFPDEFVLTVS